MFDRQRAQAVMDKVKTAVATILEEEDGLAMGKVSGSFGDLNLKLTLTLNMTGDDGLTQEGLDFQRVAKLHGMKPEWLGQTFYSRGKQFTIVGFNSKRHTYPVSTRDAATGKSFKFPIDAVTRGMEKRG